jgi:Ca2+/Na+ antiporter
LFLSILAGVEWLEFIVVLMIDILNFVQFQTGFSDLLMGMTILGISNSCVDLFINRALAIQGYEILAVTGIFAGQMFNFLMGFGISSLMKQFKSTKEKPLNFNLYSFDTIYKERDNMLTFNILLAALLTLVFLFAMLFIGKYSFGGKVAVIGFSWYLIVLTAMFSIELTHKEA